MPDNSAPDWFHLRAIGNFINSVGFPVAMACALTFVVWRDTQTLSLIATDLQTFHKEHAAMTEAQYQVAVSNRALLDYLEGKNGCPPPAPPAPPP